MKVTIELDDLGSIAELVATLQAVLDRKDRAEPEPPSREKRGRPRVTGAKLPAANGHLAQRDLLDEPIEVKEPPTEELPIQEPTEGTLQDPRQGELDLDAAREMLRAKAKELGVAWLRSTLDAAGVGRLGDLTEAQVRVLLLGA